MKFLWPEALWAAAVLAPLLVLLYLWLLHRRKKSTVRFASIALVRQALGKGPGWRRHVPPLLLGLALLTLMVAVSRPTAVIKLPSQQETIILAMDVSGSMRASDIKPTRLAASQEAAKNFVNDLPNSVRIGVVAFAGTAAVVQAPTLSREDVVAAIDRFQLQRATAIGSGIVLSLATLFPDAGYDLSQITGARPMPPGFGDKQQEKPAFKPVEPGSYASAAIILLTDGQRTTGPDTLEMAKLAADRGVRIYTVGMGTTQGEIIGFDGWSMRVRLDEETLKQVALLTRGEYFYAGTAEDLKKVYQGLSSKLVVEKRETEITALFTALGALLALLAAGLSLWWFGRVT
ncbi:MAG: VWA domain-containing protein [Burkholderiaceae bacterium]|nr:MAG: VWA domain-containing protein [Burkholderiaceae bacterium]MBE7427397.1 VWA domain-containing protein [Ideonella sp.]MCC7284850.1 VWA domain-containing protein [Burkholderiaceae bacterium]